MITLQLKRTARNLSEDIVSTFIPEVGEPFLIESDVNSSGSFVADDCITPSSTVRKDVYLKEEDWDLFAWNGPYLPRVGQTVFVKFQNENAVVNPTLTVSADSIQTTAKNIAYRDGDSYNTDILNSVYNWLAGETRVFTFNGTYWVIQTPEDYLENSLLFIGNGFDTVGSMYNSGTYIPVSKFISDDMIKNGSITIKKLDPNINLATKDALEQIQNALDNYQSETDASLISINDRVSIDKIYYVNCSSAQSAVKTVTIPDIKVFTDRRKYDGLTLVIKFSYSNTMENPTMIVKSSINNTTIIPQCPMYVGEEPLGSVFYWNRHDSVMFSYNAEDNRWYMSSTSASSKIAEWCSQNDVTMINGGKIATGSITADSIAAGTITSNEIAVGSLGASVFNPEIANAVSNLNDFKRQCASAGTIVAECRSSASDSFKSVSVSVDEVNSIMVTNTGMPLVGTSMVVKFQNANSYQGNVYLQVKADTGNTSYNKFVAQLGFKIGDAFINIGSLGVQEFSDSQIVALNYYKWDAGEYRTVMFDGNYWIISVTTEYLSNLAEWCLLNGQTWIGGGTIVTGTIVADQIQSGSIDTAKVSLVCMAPDEYGDIMNYGGVGYYEGSSSGTVTRGICMFGATPSDDPDGEPDYNVAITDTGLKLNINGGCIQGWSNDFRFDARRLLFGHYANDYSSGTLNLFFENLPTSDTGLSVGQVYSDSGTLKIKT